MSDDLHNFDPLDPGRINTHIRQLQYWCRQPALHRVGAEDGLAKVGDHVTAVRNQLALRR